MSFSASNSFSPSKLQLWGGVECTVNRIEDTYMDQLELNGHAYRLEDLDAIASLGIKTLRYPVIWERVAPESLETADWSWTDERLERLRELEIVPIAGLLHHGSGPRHTSLTDSDFPEKLASYAKAVATRYPWLDAYTPVNEPLTTARFSGLYGHWYPHGRNFITFAKALLNECKGTVLAMAEIRKINPAARLIQTEDLGKIYCTPLLAYQADYENERRWLSFDLLTGRLTPDKMMWRHLVKAGIPAEQLQWFLDNPCPPDVLGVNHYVTSDRYLDECLENYPAEYHGENGTHAYADVHATRVHPLNYEGHDTLLRETYERYNIPLAVTEAHLGATREEQLRWLHEIWNTGLRLNREGIPVLAITVWSLLGAYDWNTLLTRRNGFYESGVFDMTGGHPRPTALAEMIKSLTQTSEYSHPLLETQGWWRRPDRYHFPLSHVQKTIVMPDCERLIESEMPVRPIAIVGANGTLGRAFAKACQQRGITCALLSRQQMEMSDPASVEAAIKRYNPWAMINAAGFVRVDDAETEREKCWQDNVTGPANLASLCLAYGLPFLTFSSDLVFDGKQQTPYLESDAVNPLNVYGESKAESEQTIAAINPQALIVRTSAFFSPWDDYNFITIAMKQLAEGRTFSAADNWSISPTYVPDLTDACLNLLIDGESGIWHLANTGDVTWADLAKLAASFCGLKPDLVKGVKGESFGYAAARPLYSVLGSSRGFILPPLQDALLRYSQNVSHHFQSKSLPIA